MDLIKAADKYQILDLKKICENKIIKLLKSENALSLLAVADQSNASVLKEKTMEFIVVNAKTIIEKPEFNSLPKLHPKIICELFRKIVLKDD